MYLVKIMSGPARTGQPTFIVLNRAGRSRNAVKRRLASLINVISSGLSLNGTTAHHIDLPRIIDNLLDDSVISHGHQTAMDALLAHNATLSAYLQASTPTVRVRFSEAGDTGVEDLRVTLNCRIDLELTRQILNSPHRHGAASSAILNRLTSDYPASVVMGTDSEDFESDPVQRVAMVTNLAQLFPDDTDGTTLVGNESSGTSGYSFQFRSLPSDFFDISNKKSSKPPKPKLVPSEDEMIVNVEELASDLANHRLKSENLTVDKNIERYNRYLTEYTEIIDKAKAARKD